MHPVERLLVPLGRALRNRRPDESLSIAESPSLATPNRITVTSPAFAEGAEIPARNCGWLIGANAPFALELSELPAGTADLLLIFEDLDAPGRVPTIHFAAAVSPARSISEADFAPQNARYLKHRLSRYMGPRPIPAHGPHRYRMHVYALDTVLDIRAVRGVGALPAAVEGHVLASGVLTGTRES